MLRIAKASSSPVVCRRLLSTASQRSYASASHVGALRVNSNRLWNELHYTCQWGTGERWGKEHFQTGMSRLTLSDADKEVRNWFVATTKELGCNVTVDAMGNIFAVRPGRREGAPTSVGSHLDTQPAGGRYDGILGVLAGVEMLRVLKDNKVETEFPLAVINWTNEEGARFPKSMISSAVWAGAISLEDAYSLPDVDGSGRTMLSELERIGYKGKTPASFAATPIAAHFELHIEQGPILESQGRKIGVVEGVQAYRWYDVVIKGRGSHTGTTPFPNRRDALLAASRFINSAHDVVSQKLIDLQALASFGILKTYPGSVNTVPGKVELTLDVRATDDKSLEIADDQIGTTWDRIVTETNRNFHEDPISYERRLTFESPAVNFDQDCISCVRESAEQSFGKDEHLVMRSGAGHDSVCTSRHVPSSMIFVPCVKGISHHPTEFSSQQDCANGAQVLLDSVLRYDQLRARRVA